jgi:hypothetical protein
MLREELKRQSRVVDLMLTMHSILAIEYKRRAQALEISLLASSILLVALTFVDTEVRKYFSISTETAKIAIGIFSIFIFFLSAVSLVVNWKGKATEHDNAFRALIPLKSEWREILTADEYYDERQSLEFSRKPALIMGTLIPIPDAKFNRLKARHQRKVVLSKLVSAHPGSSVVLLRLCLSYRTNKKAWNPKLPK